MELKNIVNIDVITTGNVGSFIPTGKESCKVSDSGWTELPIQVPAKMTVETSVSDKDQLIKSTVVFRTCKAIAIKQPYTLRLHLADGRKVLVGTDHRPYNIATYQEVFPDNASDSQLKEYTIVRTATDGPMYIE